MTKTTLDRWKRLMSTFELGLNQNIFETLITLYSEKHRAYHTIEHITACIDHLEQNIKFAQRPNEIELSLWFHDAIYNPYSKTNEEDSAAMAVTFLNNCNIKCDVISRIERLILITKSHNDINSPDEAIMIDIDLSVIGAPPNIFDQYERNIRFEYKYVPYFIYKKKRKAILQGFLDVPRIYHTDIFHDLWDKQARQNITRSLAYL